MFKFRGRRQARLGVREGRLAAVTAKPNNVSSQADAEDRQHYVAPFSYSGGASLGMQKLKKILEQMPRVALIEARADYLYAEFSSAVMGFVDDVEFYNDGKLIQVRSASRLGYSDVGANRKRIESLRQALNG